MLVFKKNPRFGQLLTTMWMFGFCLLEKFRLVWRTFCLESFCDADLQILAASTGSVLPTFCYCKNLQRFCKVVHFKTSLGCARNVVSVRSDGSIWNVLAAGQLRCVFSKLASIVAFSEMQMNQSRRTKGDVGGTLSVFFILFFFMWMLSRINLITYQNKLKAR